MKITEVYKLIKLSNNIGGIIDPYDGRKLDNNKLTAMMWYVGDQIASY
jgi:hypothetical protein